MKGDIAAAVRKGMIVNIAADDLRMGDLVLIQTGDIVPADLKLLEALDLEVDEFGLTGEIMPVPKCVEPETEVRVFQGSHVLRGHGKGVVIAAGEDTEYGKILKQSRATWQWLPAERERCQAHKPSWVRLVSRPVV